MTFAGATTGGSQQEHVVVDESTTDEPSGCPKEDSVKRRETSNAVVFHDESSWVMLAFGAVRR